MSKKKILSMLSVVLILGFLLMAIGCVGEAQVDKITAHDYQTLQAKLESVENVDGFTTAGVIKISHRPESGWSTTYATDVSILTKEGKTLMIRSWDNGEMAGLLDVGDIIRFPAPSNKEATIIEINVNNIIVVQKYFQD